MPKPPQTRCASSRRAGGATLRQAAEMAIPAMPPLTMNHSKPGTVMGICVPGTTAYGLVSTEAQSTRPVEEHTSGTLP